MQHIRKSLEQSFGGIGFGEEDEDTFERGLAGTMSGSQTTRGDDADLGIHSLQRANRRGAVHERHHHVSQHDCNFVELMIRWSWPSSSAREYFEI